jgi:hypothetical protein
MEAGDLCQFTVTIPEFSWTRRRITSEKSVRIYVNPVEI